MLAEVHRLVGDTAAYVTFDIDALDPAYAPGTGTPEVGGLSTHYAQQLLRGLGDPSAAQPDAIALDIVGADVVEVPPRPASLLLALQFWPVSTRASLPHSQCPLAELLAHLFLTNRCVNYPMLCLDVSTVWLVAACSHSQVNLANAFTPPSHHSHNQAIIHTIKPACTQSNRYSHY